MWWGGGRAQKCSKPQDSSMKIAIIGAGNIGTHFAISFASMGDEVHIYSTRSKEISKNLELVDENSKIIKTAKIALVSDDLKVCLCGVDMIFITTPAQIANEICAKILPFISSSSSICFVPGGGGVEFAFKPCLEKGAKIYAISRVPSIARLIKYGKRLWASKPRAKLFISCLGGAKSDDFLEVLSKVFDCEVCFLNDFLNISLAGSNAILHTARLFVIFKNYEKGKFYNSLPLFYEKWDDESSELLLGLDDELQSICRALSEFDLSGIKSIKEHYESQNIGELSAKIRSIPAFKGLKTPAIFIENKGFKPDFGSRYFVADFGYGLEVLARIAALFEVEVQKMKEVLSWYKSFSQSEKSFDFTRYKIKNKNDFIDFYKKYSCIY